MNSLLRAIAPLTTLALTLTGCGGGGDDPPPPPPPPPATFSIVSSITGLTASGLVLQNNGVNVTVASGASQATLASNVNSGSPYAVTVQTQPTGLNCIVANGSGTVSGNVTNIAITCSPVVVATYTISGTITGYTGSGLGLRLNGQTGADFNAAPTTGAANFTFAAALASGTTYAVGVAAQPTNPPQRCVVSSGGGTIGTANVTNVSVTCTDAFPYTVGGTVTGLTGTGLSLTMGYSGATAPEVLDVPATAPTFTFTSQVPANGGFNVGIRTQPAGQTCVMTRGRGSSSAPVTDIAFVCVDHVANALRGTYSLLLAEGRQYLNFNPDGTFTTALIHNDTGCNAPGETRNGNGVEYGIFDWNPATGGFSMPRAPVVDNNGECGLANSASFVDSFDGTLQRSGTTLIVLPVGESPLNFTAVESPDPANSLVGAYIDEGNHGRMLVMHADNTYLIAETQGRVAQQLGQERGCYQATATHVTFSVGSSCRPDGLDSYDLNGGFGIGPFSNSVTSIGPVPFMIENSSSVIIGPFRYRRTTHN